MTIDNVQRTLLAEITRELVLIVTENSPALDSFFDGGKTLMDMAFNEPLPKQRILYFIQEDTESKLKKGRQPLFNYYSRLDITSEDKTKSLKMHRELCKIISATWRVQKRTFVSYLDPTVKIVLSLPEVNQGGLLANIEKQETTFTARIEIEFSAHQTI